MATNNDFLESFAKATKEEKEKTKKLPKEELLARMFNPSKFFPGATFKITDWTYYEEKGVENGMMFYVFETTLGELWCSMITKVRNDLRTNKCVTASGTFDMAYRKLLNEIANKKLNVFNAFDKFVEAHKDKTIVVDRIPILSIIDGKEKATSFVELNYAE